MADEVLLVSAEGVPVRSVAAQVHFFRCDAEQHRYVAGLTRGRRRKPHRTFVGKKLWTVQVMPQVQSKTAHAGEGEAV